MRVSIVDYGLSNLLSVQRAVEALGHEPLLARTGAELRRARALILPGVGAFAGGMAGLAKRGMAEPLLARVAAGVPLLGICLGMQLLFEESCEHGLHRGLGLLPGRVADIPARDVNGEGLRVPHVGWAALLPPGPAGGHKAGEGGAAEHGPAENGAAAPWPPALLAGVAPGEEVYFVHGLAAKPQNRALVLAECEYGGHRLCAAVGGGRVFGTQFHPEKSGRVGLRILGNFLDYAAQVAQLM